MKPIVQTLGPCSACGACVETCPVPGLRIGDGSLEVINEEACFGCRKCEDVCPDDAICIKGIGP